MKAAYIGSLAGIRLTQSSFLSIDFRLILLFLQNSRQTKKPKALNLSTFRKVSANGFHPTPLPLCLPLLPPLTPPHFGMGFFYNKGGLFCDYAILHPLSDLASLPIFEEAALQAD